MILSRMLKFTISQIHNHGAMFSAYLAFGVCILGISLTALHPFRFELPHAALPLDLFGTASYSYEGPIILQVLERLPFALAGFLLSAVLVPDIKARSRSLFIGFIMIAGIEIAQVFVAGRHARWSDFLFACCLFGIGVLSGTTARTRISETTFRAINILLRAGSAIAILVLVWWGQTAQKLTAWNCEYKLGLGNEIGMQRQWIGALHRVRISNERSTIEIFPFNTQTDPLWIEPLSRLVPTQISESFCDQAKSDKKISVRAEIEPSGKSLNGPARILTWSSSIYDQNIMIGEQDHRIHFRVKSGSSAFPAVTEISAPLPEDAAEKLDIEATVDGGKMSLTIANYSAATGHTTRVSLNNGLTLSRYPIMAVLIAMIVLLSVDKSIRQPTSD